mgnify:CR=1 FL=1
MLSPENIYLCVCLYYIQPNTVHNTVNRLLFPFLLISNNWRQIEFFKISQLMRASVSVAITFRVNNFSSIIINKRAG